MDLLTEFDFLPDCARFPYNTFGNSGGRVVGLRSKRTGVRFPASLLEFSEIGYLLLPSQDMAERSLNRR